MCAEALQGLWLMVTALDFGPQPSTTGLLFGWASWHIREVGAAVCVNLFNYNPIPGYE